MSRDKSVWFAEEILLDAKLINFQLETGEWDAVEEMLRAEAQLSRDSETGKLRPKKASEYTLRLIAEVLHIMRLDIEQAMYNLSTLAVAEQCLRLIRSCAASGMKIQTYISKDLSILDDMLMICTKYQHPNGEFVNEEIVKKYESCMIVLVQMLGNLVVNNPFNQIIIWDKFGATILDCLIGNNDKIASSAAMIVYNILLGQPNILPDDVLLLNSLALMYSTGNSEFPHLIIEYLVGVENSYIEKLYNRLEADTKLLILNLAYNILMFNETQDINVSVNFIKFISHEFKVKSDCILKTVDKYVNSIEPQEVVYLLDIIATASSMDAYMDCLQNDVSLFINCAFLLRLIHKIGKESNNFFSSINKLYDMVGKTVPSEVAIEEVPAGEKDSEATPSTESLKKNDSAENILQCHETMSCTESESSEQYYECNDQFPYLEKIEAQNTIETLQPQLKFVEAAIDTKTQSEGPVRETISGNVTIDDQLNKVSFVKTLESVSEDISEIVLEADESLILNTVEPGSGSQSRKDSVEQQKTYIDDEPPLIIDEPHLNNNQSRKSSTDNQELSTVCDIPKNPLSGNQSRKNSIENQVSDIPTIDNVALESTDESPIQENVMISSIHSDTENVMISSIHSDTENLQSNVDVEQKTIPEVRPTQPFDLSTVPQPNKPVTSSVDTTAVKEVKRSQNLSTDFDLSEQLQKILGISADKALKAEIGDMNKERLPPVVKEVKIAEPVQVKLPLVKIDSPESAQKQKLECVDQSKPKKVRTMVESVEQHVAFGFKASLIRTLGNLCWKNQINKRQIRELEVIPVLLDCCNIDARNPLITQWVIFAVRNLCENCPENQNVIASLSLQRAVDNEMLHEMGLTLHTDAQKNTIKLVPLPKK